MISKKENNQQVQYTLIIGNVMGQSMENIHADVQFSSD